MNYLVGKLTKVVLSMTVLFAAPAFGVTPQVATAQTEAPITVIQPQGTIASVMAAVEKQTGLHFFYNDRDVRLSDRMSIKISDGSLDQVLDAFRAKGLECEINNGLIILTKSAVTQSADKVSVRGKVVDKAGEPILSATIVVLGVEGKGAISDIDGNFVIKDIPADATLRISYVGMVTQEIKLAGRATLTITLREDSELLEEVVVVGYGVQKKSVVTGSIAQVSSDDLKAKAPVRMDNALKGLAAGVNVTSASGQPGSQPRIIIRGNGTINDNTPLFIVDGMPIEGGLDYLNPNDIASI